MELIDVKGQMGKISNPHLESYLGQPTPSWFEYDKRHQSYPAIGFSDGRHLAEFNNTPKQWIKYNPK